MWSDVSTRGGVWSYEGSQLVLGFTSISGEAQGARVFDFLDLTILTKRTLEVSTNLDRLIEFPSSSVCCRMQAGTNFAN